MRDEYGSDYERGYELFKQRMDKQQRFFKTLIPVGIVVLLALAAATIYIYPKIRVYQQEMEGKAELARAESNRQIATLEARQAMESAEYLNKAEVIRAQGVAQANRIIADGLGGSEGYLRYLWIQSLSGNGSQPQIIYVPTEAGLPILEAGKR